MGMQNGIVLFLIGCMWELIEHVLGKSRPTWLGGCPFNTNENDEGRPWWYGRVSDIFVNMAGILLANYLN
jgi:hypothetical protein